MAYAAISKPSLHFDGKTYLGSSNAVTVTGLGFQPDLVWVKDRDNANNHCLVDVVRGTGKYMSSNNTTAEVNNSSQSISAFTSDGFTTGTANPANEAASTTLGFMSWNWKAGNSAGSSNSDGSITSTVSANTTAGFSIVKYTGTGSNATVGHGLGAAPKMVIVRRISPGGEWYVHASQLNDNEKVLVLNTTAANANASTVFNNTAPTSSVFSLGTNGDANGNTYEHIAYCFAEKKGYSKFGKYVGNGNADGTFVYTGFKPAFFLIKRYDGVEGWYLMDAIRNPSNLTSRQLFPASNSVENNMTSSSQVNGDILSNGFKVRATDTAINASDGGYIYMAFAENPLVANITSNGIPATAR